jgi:hypothetical protein
VALAFGRLAWVLGGTIWLIGCSSDVPIGDGTGGTGGSATGGGGSAGTVASGGGSAGQSVTGGQGGTAGGPSCSTGYDAGSTGTSCTTDSDCQTNEVCGYKVSDACSASGQCFPRGQLCNCFSPACACDGTTINAVCSGLPDGYAPQAVAHAGKCDTDGGTGDFACAQTGVTCTAPGQYCYGGAETVFYNGDGGIVVGCNAWPPECDANKTCACLNQFYQAGFCTCTEDNGAVTMQCSTV